MTFWNCAEVGEQMELFAAGECDPVTQAAVARHLAACPICAAGCAETRRLLDLLDWRLREDDGLQRLQKRLRAEAQTIRIRLRRFPFFRPLAAVAALLMVLFGMFRLFPPDAATPEETPVLVATLLPGKVARGQQEIKTVPAEAMKAARDEKVPDLVLHRKEEDRTAAASRRRLREAARAGQLPPPPEVSLRLQLRNDTTAPLEIRPDAPSTELRFTFDQLGVEWFDAPSAPEPPFLTAPRIRLAPGESFTLPVPRLIDGSRDWLRYHYFIEPGDYTLRMRYTVTVVAPRDGPRKTIVLSAPLLLRVE